MKKITIFISLLLIPSFTYGSWIDIKNEIDAKSSNTIDWVIDWIFPNYIEEKIFTWSLLWLTDIERSYTYAQTIELSWVTRSATGEILSYQNFNDIVVWTHDYSIQINRTNQLQDDIRITLFIFVFMYIFFETRKILRVYTYNNEWEWKK